MKGTHRKRNGTIVRNVSLAELINEADTVPDIPAIIADAYVNFTRVTTETTAAMMPAVRMPVIKALVPAHNEEKSIGATIEALLNQTTKVTEIIVIADNCDDQTEQVARQYPVTVLRTENNAHRKSGALNMAWNQRAHDADYIIGLDADTILPPEAVQNWVAGMEAEPGIGGMSSKFTMLGGNFLTRLQRLEFARWSQTSIKRGHTSVLAGTGCMIRGDALREVAKRDDREGPWAYWSAVEDFELTYRIRQLGYQCRVASNVPAYTDSMKTLQSLWAQRMKWQVGTVHDLLLFGFNKLTMRDWTQQFLGMLNAIVRILWLLLWVISAAIGVLHVQWTWWAFPLFFAAADFLTTFKFKERDRLDLFLSVSLLPMEVFAWMRAGWFIASWWKILSGRSGMNDLWAAQYAVDGTDTHASAH